MRFLVSSAPEVAARARPPVRAFLAFVVALLAGVLAQRAAGGQLTPAGVVDAYVPMGEALPTVSLLEELHGAGFIWGFLLLALGSLLVASPLAPRTRALLTWVPAVACALDLAAPFVVVAQPGLAVVRVAGGLLAVGSLAAATAVVFARFGRNRER